MPELVRIADNDWITIYSDAVQRNTEKMWEAYDLLGSNAKMAEKIFREIIAECGNCALEAFNDLGELFLESNRIVEAAGTFAKAYEIAKSTIPKDFKVGKDRIPWGFLENRPLLRAFCNNGFQLFEEERFEEASQIFHFILQVNPDDNQGARYLLLDCYFQQGLFREALELCKQYPDEYSIDFKYGKALAYLGLNQTKDALRQYEFAKKCFPTFDEMIRGNVGLMKAYKAYLKSKVSDHHSSRDKEEAFEYWNKYAHLWIRFLPELGIIKTNPSK
jgi:tetratricopeptide (TPR) repeat protein